MPELPTFDQLLRLMPISLIVMTIAGTTVWTVLQVQKVTLRYFRDSKKKKK